MANEYIDYGEMATDIKAVIFDIVDNEKKTTACLKDKIANESNEENKNKLNTILDTKQTKLEDILSNIDVIINNIETLNNINIKNNLLVDISSNVDDNKETDNDEFKLAIEESNEDTNNSNESIEDNNDELIIKTDDETEDIEKTNNEEDSSSVVIEEPEDEEKKVEEKDESTDNKELEDDGFSLVTIDESDTNMEDQSVQEEQQETSSSEEKSEEENTEEDSPSEEKVEEESTEETTEEDKEEDNTEEVADNTEVLYAFNKENKISPKAIMVKDDQYSKLLSSCDKQIEKITPIGTFDGYDYEISTAHALSGDIVDEDIEKQIELDSKKYDDVERFIEDLTVKASIYTNEGEIDKANTINKKISELKSGSVN